MSYAERMMATNPNRTLVDADTLALCIEACLDCAQACTACADACLGEEDVSAMVKCIRDDLDCADVCAATGSGSRARPSPRRP